MIIKARINKPKVLIAPLDWGLGHATRCIPIIKALLANNCNVLIACNNLQKKLFEQEFEQIEILPLVGYNITYASNPKLLAISILKQLPKISSIIKQENFWLNALIDECNIDLVISDNRYGLYTSKIPCVFVTHQLQIKAPLYTIEKLLQKINYHFINKYNFCWIPDFENEKNIAGTLSHPKILPIVPISYIEPLCRFEIEKTNIINYNLCISLSGPEPQRTVLEKKILQEINTISAKIILIRGLPNSNEQLELPQNVTVFNHLSGKYLGEIFQQSEIIICRSGYTTIMEIIALQKKAILIPTPGQTEQEYLAKKLMQQGCCYSIKQKDFTITEAFEKSKTFNFQLPPYTTTNLNQFISQFLAMYIYN